MDINNLTLGQVKEISQLAGNLTGNKKSADCCGMVRIVVLQRGWIAVGKITQSGDEIIISNASVVRRWGTTQGLGEIAINGPKAETVLDKCPDIRAHILTVVFQLDCSAEKWSKHVC